MYIYFYSLHQSLHDKIFVTFKVQAYFYTLLTFQNLDKICKNFYFAINNNN